jgi:hypothetical protein
VASGRLIAASFALVILAAAVIIVAYKWQGEEERVMHFERAGEPPANLTVHALEFRPVQKAFFLADHFEQASLQGRSQERVALRIDNMQQTLTTLTGHAGPEWWVHWEGITYRIWVESAAA